MKKIIILTTFLLASHLFLSAQTDKPDKNIQTRINFLREMVPEKKAELFPTMQALYDQNHITLFTLNEAKSDVAVAYAKNNNWDAAKKWLMDIPSLSAQKETICKLADLLLNEKQYPKALQLVKPYVGTMSDDNDDDRWLEVKYGEILLQTKDYERAVHYLTPIAYDTTSFYTSRFEKIPAHYAMALAGTNKTKEAELIFRQILRKGGSSNELREAAQAFFIKNKGSDEQYLKLMDSVRSRMREQLQLKMVNVPAPNFELKDLNGKQVSLQELKGKIVVLDFWATWCGPCVMSLPAMQQLANDYANDPSVVFLFIHTLEERGTGQDKILAEINGIIKRKKYTFRTLMDWRDPASKNKSKTALAYQINSIPAKFVIDKKGMICFDNNVNVGHDNMLIDNMKVMIELARKQ